MNYKIIKTEEEYQKNLARFAEIFDASEGSLDSDEADILALLIKNMKMLLIQLKHQTQLKLLNLGWNNQICKQKTQQIFLIIKVT